MFWKNQMQIFLLVEKQNFSNLKFKQICFSSQNMCSIVGFFKMLHDPTDFFQHFCLNAFCGDNKARQGKKVILTQIFSRWHMPTSKYFTAQKSINKINKKANFICFSFRLLRQRTTTAKSCSFFSLIRFDSFVTCWKDFM